MFAANHGPYQSVHIGQHSSTPTLCTSGVPQGSVLGPLLFTIFTSPVSNIASLHNVHQHQYADATQLFISLSPTHFSSEISNLACCLPALNSWFCIYGLALNPDKSDAIVLGTRQRSASYSSLTTVDVAGSRISLSDHIKVLGVTLDKHLTTMSIQSRGRHSTISELCVTFALPSLRTWRKPSKCPRWSAA